ncbi:MAG: DUF2723 domain-containing protein, partial [Anaerolineae bacterium]|nr:DUF2723 domain-containing protein [Anaerolineae bacterium]
MQSQKSLPLNKQTWLAGLAAALVFSVMLVLYVDTLLPGLVGGDAGEMQYAPPILALTHPTGMPLYIFVGHLWAELVPIGSVAYRMNLLAAVSGAAACAALAGFGSRLHGSVIGLAAGLTLGVGTTFWSQAVIADKYAFNALLVVLVLGLAALWSRQRRDAGLILLSAVYGLSLLHHRTMILFGPGLAALVIYQERWAVLHRWRRSLLCGLLVFGPPLVVYPLALPWLEGRGLDPYLWRPQTLGGWIDWLLERHIVQQALQTEDLPDYLAGYARTLAGDYSVVVIGLALVGLAALARRERAMFLLLA